MIFHKSNWLWPTARHVAWGTYGGLRVQPPIIIIIIIVVVIIIIIIRSFEIS